MHVWWFVGQGMCLVTWSRRKGAESELGAIIPNTNRWTETKETNLHGGQLRPHTAVHRLSLTCFSGLFLSQKAGFSVVLFVGPWLLTLLRLSLISVMPGLLAHGPNPLRLPSPITRALASKMHLESCPQTQAYPIVFHKVIAIGRGKKKSKLWIGIYVLPVQPMTLITKGTKWAICCSVYLANLTQVPTSLSRFYYSPWAILWNQECWQQETQKFEDRTCGNGIYCLKDAVLYLMTLKIER